MRVEGARATRRRGKRTEQAMDPAELRSGLWGWDAVRGEAKARNAKARTPGSLVELPTLTRAGCPQAGLGLALALEEDSDLVPRSPRPCASFSTQSAWRVRPERSRRPRCPRSRGPPRGRQGPGRKGTPPRLCPRPSALRGIKPAPQPPPPGGRRRRARSWRSLLARNQARRHCTSQLL